MEKRLNRLATIWPPPLAGCDTCRHWQNVEIVTFDRPLRPEICSACKRRLPIVTAVQIDGVSWDEI